MDKKTADPCIKDCANCETSGANLTCAKCKAAHYCSKACQTQHWKNGHKGMCFAPEKRRPPTTDSTLQRATDLNGEKSEECPICFETVSDETLCILPCEHEFHQECVDNLRKHGVLQACPLCRAALPPGPEKLYEDSMRKYVVVIRKVQSGTVSWRTLETSDQKKMAEVSVMLATAGNQGHAEAQYRLAGMYHGGEGVAQDYNEAVRWYLKAADQGYTDAQFSLGFMYRNGQGVAQNFKEAMRWYRKAAEQGGVKAQCNLAGMYRDGEGVAQDHKEAMRWYRKAAEQRWHARYASAQCNLGVLCHIGKGVAQNYKEAARWFQKAAEQGFAEAQFCLANMYHDGEGVAQDHKEAARWYRKAAEQGGVHVQFNLAIMYRDGEGVAQNFKEAMRWYRKAAEQGDVDAQHDLGAMYYHGEGIAQDHKEAVRWYRKAADQGFASSQFLLGNLCYYGKVGLPIDRQEAVRLFSAAAEQGHTEAKAFLANNLGSISGPSPPPPPPPQCAVCGRDSENGLKLKPCPRCKRTCYCGVECQRVHWKEGHKMSCAPKNAAPGGPP